jgi:hypothetical protein
MQHGHAVWTWPWSTDMDKFRIFTSWQNYSEILLSTPLCPRPNLPETQACTALVPCKNNLRNLYDKTQIFF